MSRLLNDPRFADAYQQELAKMNDTDMDRFTESRQCQGCYVPPARHRNTEGMGAMVWAVLTVGLALGAWLAFLVFSFA